MGLAVQRLNHRPPLYLINVSVHTQTHTTADKDTQLLICKIM